MKKKILVFADYFEPGYKAGGPIRTLKNIFESLHEDFDFYLITRNHDLGDDKKYHEPTSEWINRGTYNVLYLPNEYTVLHYAKAAIRNLNPHTIYFNSFFSSFFSIIPIFFLKKYRTKMVVASRGEFSKGSIIEKNVKKVVFIFFAKVIGMYKNIRFHASGEGEVAEIKEYFSSNKIYLAPDLVGKIEQSSKANYEKSTNQLRLCFISRISPVKNLDLIIHTLYELKNVLPNIYLDIYGPQEDKDYYYKCHKLIETYNLENQIVYRSILRPENVGNTFKNYDFFVLPTKGENFCHAVFESLSVGTPVILSNTTFWNKFQAEKNWSFIFDLASKDAFHKVLKEAYIMNETAYKSMSQCSFEIAKKFTQTDIVSKTKNVFS